MNEKNKAAFPITVGAEGKTASIQQREIKQHIIALTVSSQFVSHARRWFKTLLVHLACWEMLPGALAVFLLGGVSHD